MRAIERRATKATWVLVAVSLALAAWIAGVSFSTPEGARAGHVIPTLRNLSTVATSGGSVANNQCVIRVENEVNGPVGVGTQERALQLITTSALCNVGLDLEVDFDVHQVKCQFSENLDQHPQCIVERLRLRP